MPVMTNQNLASTDKLIYNYLLEKKRDAPTGNLELNNTVIGEAIGVHSVSASKSLKKLESEGYIKLEYSKKKRFILINY